MQTFLVVLAVFLIAVTLMALGTILAKKPLRGSCGGLGMLRNLLGLGPCSSCEDDPEAKAESCSRARRERDRRQRDTIEV